MNHGFAKGRSCRANLAAEDRFSECRKRAELLVIVRLLLWKEVTKRSWWEGSSSEVGLDEALGPAGGVSWG